MQDLDGLHETPRHGRMAVTLLKPEDAVGMLVKAAQQPQVRKALRWGGPAAHAWGGAP